MADEEVRSLYVLLVCETCGENLKEIDSGSEVVREFVCPKCHATVAIHAKNNPLYYRRGPEEEKN